MTTYDLKANVRHRPGIAIIDLGGELNGFVNNVLITAYADAASRNPASLFLNFERVNYINSTGIGFLLDLVGRAQRSQQVLIAYGLSSFYAQLFQIVGLTQFIRIVPDEANALSLVSTPVLG